MNCSNGHSLAEHGTDKRGRCRECLREYRRRYKQRHPERDRESKRRSAAKARRERPEATAAARRRWRERNPEKWRESRRASKRRWAANHRDDIREYQRFWTEAKRREAGVPRRNFKRQPPRDRNEPLEIPAAPFAALLEAKAETLGKARTAVEADLSHRRVDAIINEQEAVHLDLVDRVLTRTGWAFLWELYPGLYE